MRKILNAITGEITIDAAHIDPTPSPAEVLAAERAGMTPYKRAFFEAMRRTPIGQTHMLAAFMAEVETARALDPFAPLVMWRDHVTQIVRTHPDMDAFGAAFSMTPEALDDLCRLALAIERGEA